MFSNFKLDNLTHVIIFLKPNINSATRLVSWKQLNTILSIIKAIFAVTRKLIKTITSLKQFESICIYPNDSKDIYTVLGIPPLVSITALEYNRSY